MFSPFDEFPHAISKGKLEVAGRPPYQIERFVSEDVIKGFMDTPTTSESLKFHQMSQEYDRNLYVPYQLPISKNTLFKYEGRIYGIVGEPVDQGGQHEINLVRLKERPNGKS